jgi:hypothetical protein
VFDLVVTGLRFRDEGKEHKETNLLWVVWENLAAYLKGMNREGCEKKRKEPLVLG